MNPETSPALRSPLLMIGLDAAEPSLIERWIGEGHLPALAALRGRGSWIRLDPAREWMVGALWPGFYSSAGPEEFGMYHYLVWRPEHMRTERPAPSWMPLRPFWRELPARGRRVIALDVPLCYSPEQDPGIEVSGWATHELIQEPGSSPPGLLREIRREFGRTPLRTETSHQLSLARCLAIRDECMETARQVGELGSSLMVRYPWDLMLVCFSSLHRAGHLLWDRTILKGRPDPAGLEAFDEALRDVYIQCDAAVGRLVARAGPEAAVMVFSLHGMGPNPDRTCLLDEMLARILQNRRSEGSPVRAPRMSERFRVLIPRDWRAPVKARLPRALRDRLTIHWRTPKTSWPSTRAFAAFCDLDGFVRVNLRGRERDGIVAPSEYRGLCEEIAAGLGTFRDADTGEPLAQAVECADDLFGPGPMRQHLPDLVVRWADSSAAAHRRVVSRRFGWMAWPTPGRHPAGRSGNHRRPGFLIAAGQRFEAARLPPAGRIIDLAPTATDLLGLAPLPGFRGVSLLAERR